MVERTNAAKAPETRENANVNAITTPLMFTLDSNAAGAAPALAHGTFNTFAPRVDYATRCGWRSGREPSSSAARIWSAFSKTKSEGSFAKADRQDLHDYPTHGFAAGENVPRT
jgi:hypothetical protein